MTLCRGSVDSATLGKQFILNVHFDWDGCFLSISGYRIYWVGGHHGSTYLKTVEAYDPENQP
jgi:hypothetical protein